MGNIFQHSKTYWWANKSTKSWTFAAPWLIILYISVSPLLWTNLTFKPFGHSFKTSFARLKPLSRKIIMIAGLKIFSLCNSTSWAIKRQETYCSSLIIRSIIWGPTAWWVFAENSLHSAETTCDILTSSTGKHTSIRFANFGAFRVMKLIIFCNILSAKKLELIYSFLFPWIF